MTWHGCGSFRLAYTEDEMDWLRHTLSVGQFARLSTWNWSGRAGSPNCTRSTISTASSARCTPPTMAMSTRRASPWRSPPAPASQRARIIRQLPRHQHHPRRDRANGKVETEQGTITCEHVVNAGGTYARQMGEWSGLQLPMTSMTHHYFVTEPVPEFAAISTANCR